MRAHHHDFAESKNKIMRTFYNEQYQQYDASKIGHEQTQKEIQDRAVGLRQSHIILGKEVSLFITTFKRNCQCNLYNKWTTRKKRENNKKLSKSPPSNPTLLSEMPLAITQQLTNNI